MSKKSVSIKDIAKLAGVSIATVSRVINRNGKVAPETEKKILQVMEENHYVLNLLAKGFRTQKFTTIGIIVPDISIEFFSKIAKKVQTIFFERGYATIICNTNEDYKMERQCINMLQAQHVGGIIHIVSVTTEKEKKTSIPTVYIDREPAYGNTKKDMVLIESDNVSGGYQATNEMIKKGCKNIICFCPKDKGSTHIKRWEGYCKAMEETGGKPRLVSLDNVSEVDAYEKAIKLFGKDKEIDGVFATTDLIAIGVLKALKELKIKVPSQVKVFGYDNSLLSEIATTPIATVEQPIELMSEKAAEMLEKLMDGERPEESHIVVPVKLVKRKTGK